MSEREKLIGLMADAIGEHMGSKDRVDALHFDAARHTMRVLEAAGVRLVPVNEKPGQGWLHEAVKDACLRASKNSGGTPPQLLYAPILWAMQDALAASPYAKE